MNVSDLTYASIFTILTLLTCGALLEKKKWLRSFELIRLGGSIVIALFWMEKINHDILIIVFIFIQSSSIVWFYYLQNSKIYAQKTPGI